MSAARRTSRQDGAVSGAGIVERGKPYLALIFLFSLLLPHSFWVGPIQLKAYRLVLLVVFIPLMVQLLSGKAGKMHRIDWLIFGSALWAVAALFKNHSIGIAIEPAGVHMLEFFGAYLVARVSIRNADEFMMIARVLFGVVLVLTPFAVLESVMRHPILLDLIGGIRQRSDAGMRFGLRRAQAVFVHPIAYGVFVSCTLGLAWYALRARMSTARSMLNAAVIGIATFCSLSTAALMAFMTQLIFIAWEFINKRNPKRWTIFGWCVIVGYLFVDLMAQRSPFHVLVHRMTFSSGSAYNRILIWDHGTRNVAKNPIFGLGLNDWERPSYMSPSMDNFWLYIAVFYGLPAVGLFIGGIYLIVRRMAKAELATPAERACRAGYLTMIGGIILSGGTVHFWHTMLAYVMFMFGAGIWMTESRKAAAPAEDAASDTRRRTDLPGPIIGGRDRARTRPVR